MANHVWGSRFASARTNGGIADNGQVKPERMNPAKGYAMENEKTEKRIQHAHIIMLYLIIYDAIAVSISYFAALWLRFDLRFSAIPPWYLEAWKSFALIYVVFCIVVFWFFRLYKSIWRFASFKELERISIATLVTTISHIVLITILFQLCFSILIIIIVQDAEGSYNLFLSNKSCYGCYCRLPLTKSKRLKYN